MNVGLVCIIAESKLLHAISFKTLVIFCDNQQLLRIPLPLFKVMSLQVSFKGFYVASFPDLATIQFSSKQSKTG